MFLEQSNFHQRASWFNMSQGKKEKFLEKPPVAKTILQRIASGDQSAVQDCLDQFGGLVWSLARRMLPIKDDAEDAVQEIFIEIWKNAGRFDESKSSETTFVAMIARRRLIDRLRKIQRQPFTDSVDDMLSEPKGKDGDEIYVSIEAKQAARAIKDLRPEQQKVLQLSIVEGYSHSEISQELEMPLGTVKTHARRGIMLMRDALANREDFIREVSA